MDSTSDNEETVTEMQKMANDMHTLKLRIEILESDINAMKALARIGAFCNCQNSKND